MCSYYYVEQTPILWVLSRMLRRTQVAHSILVPEIKAVHVAYLQHIMYEKLTPNIMVFKALLKACAQPVFIRQL